MSAILDALRTGGVLDQAIAVVVAHADDESLSLGAALPRCAHLTLIHVTDSGHPSPRAWAQAGVVDYPQYVALRAQEYEAACAAGGWRPVRHLVYGIPDQTVVHALPQVLARLARDLADVDAVFTHPYEGGHPDHDALAYAVHRVCSARDTAGLPSPIRYECASYYLGAEGRVAGSFWPDARSPVTTVRVTGAALARKQAALAAYASQAGVTRWFDPTSEAYRCAPIYDVTQAPPPGRCLYERKGFMTSAAWRAAVRAAA